tara:strand:- start:2085 stop:3086 length:1002 start_codon:yes stop_codon:yes gene_type:complete
MKIIIGLFIFCLVVFIYLHVQFHLKKGDDLEIYEIDQPSKERLEEICDIRQPVVFDFECQQIIDTTNKTIIRNKYPAFEVNIRNTSELGTADELYVPLTLNEADKLFNEDKSGIYFSEKNGDFLEETCTTKNIKGGDDFLRPYMVSNCNYDILFGSNNACTPFRYEINYRNYFLLTQGSAQIKLTPPHSIKYLYPNHDYDNYEFNSPINPWTPQPKYENEFNKIKCLEFTLTPGKTLFVPAYWWYSIKFVNNASITCFYYRTYMNNIAILPHIAKHALQNQNIKRNMVRKADISELNDERVPTEEPTEEPTSTESSNISTTETNNQEDGLQPP